MRLPAPSLPRLLPALPTPSVRLMQEKVSLTGGTIPHPPHNLPGQPRAKMLSLKVNLSQDLLHPCPWQSWGQTLVPGVYARSLEPDLEEVSAAWDRSAGEPLTAAHPRLT